jgi:hypothetical protein
MKNPNDRCANCNHERKAHRIKELCCIASDYYVGQGWIKCMCTEFVEDEKEK